MTTSRAAITASRATAVRSSVLAVRVSAVILCAFGGTVMTWQFFRFVGVFPGAAVLAAILEVPLLAIGTALLCLLRPIRIPVLAWSAAAVIWGGSAAIGCAVLANDGLMSLWAKTAGIAFAANWSDSLTAPLNEELLKLCGVIMLVLAAPRLIRGPMDGLVFGALVGLGFQVAENVTYGLNSIVASGATDPVRAVASSTFVRYASALGSHWTMTAIGGAGIGYVVLHGATRRAMAVAVVCVAAAMGMHLLFDAPGLQLAVKVLVNFTVFGVVYLRLRQSYLRRARGALTQLQAVGIVTPTEAAGLPSRHWRRLTLRREGSPAALEGLRTRQREILDGVEASAALAAPACRPKSRQGQELADEPLPRSLERLSWWACTLLVALARQKPTMSATAAPRNTRLKMIWVVTAALASWPAGWTSPYPTVASVATEKYRASVLVCRSTNCPGISATTVST